MQRLLIASCREAAWFGSRWHDDSGRSARLGDVSDIPPPPGSPPPPPPPAGGAPPPPPPPAYGVAPPPGSGPGAGERAGFGSRLGGYLLDGLLYGLASVPAIIVGVVLLQRGFEDCVNIEGDLYCFGQEKPGYIAAGVIVFIVGFLAIAILYVRALAKTGQTWGRKIVGIKVVDSRTGGVPGVGKALGRSLFAWFFSGSFCWLGYLWMLWDGERQTWHDKVAGTYVVRA
jgi:uncharacterized RDD family membrane protein YckC